MAALTIFEAMRNAGIDPADARVLLRAALRVTDAHLAAHPSQPLTDAQQAVFAGWADRRRAGEPVAYLTGEREFYSLSFKVTPAVLIPRPETEGLVEAALERMPRAAACEVLDLATGSGCVAIAIARHRPQARVTATDVSAQALAVARENAATHRAGIEFIEADWFDALADRRFDVIVSNPPYIAEGDAHLFAGDLRFEPRGALAAGPQGLDAIERIVEQAPRHLRAGGWLLLEHGHDQGGCVRVLLEAAGYREVGSLRDLAGLERVAVGRV